LTTCDTVELVSLTQTNLSSDAFAPSLGNYNCSYHQCEQIICWSTFDCWTKQKFSSHI